MGGVIETNELLTSGCVQFVVVPSGHFRGSRIVKSALQEKYRDLQPGSLREEIHGIHLGKEVLERKERISCYPYDINPCVLLCTQDLHQYCHEAVGVLTPVATKLAYPLPFDYDLI